MSKLAIVGYVPPPNHPKLGICANAFVKNVTKFKPSTELILYSDHRDYNYHPILNPEMVAGKAENPRWAVNNAIFMMGVRIAAEKGISHMIYIESDCRVGCHGWDGIVFDEYFRLPFPAIAAGSLVSHSCVNGGGEFYRRFSDLIGKNRTGREHPIPIYGVRVPEHEKGKFPSMNRNVVPPGYPDERWKPAIYPNGALGVYDVAWLCEIFGIAPDGKMKQGKSMVDVVLQPAWDHVLGMRLYDRFGVDVFSVVAHLKSVFSSYGDELSTEAERLQMLLDKRAHAVHQIKSGLGI